MQGKIVSEDYDEVPYLVPNCSIAIEFLLFGFILFREFWGIVETNVYYFCLAGKDRTVLIGVAAYSYNQIEVNVSELVNVFTFVIGNVYTSFCHNFYGTGIEAVGFDAG